MRRRSDWFALVCLIALLGAAACGGNEDDNEENGEQEQRPPLEYQEERLGVMVHHGEMGNLAAQGDDGKAVLDKAAAAFDHVFLHLQIYDEHAREFGEWDWAARPAGGGDYRGPGHFVTRPDDAKLLPRATDLFDEVEQAARNKFDGKGVVIDVWRERDDWYVRWDGKLDNERNRRGEGPYGFYRSDMVESLVRQIREMATEHKPDYIVIGSDMERLLGTEDGEGLAPDGYSNFKTFYREAVGAIKQVSPDTKVGAGINWDRFARYVAPKYSDDAEMGEAPDDATLEVAFAAVVAPLVKVGDIVALKSYRSDEGDASYYGLLAELEKRFDITKPVVWYSVGSPATATSSRSQRLYAEKFREWNAGVNVELVTWRALAHIDGADAANQDVQGRCKKRIEEEDLSMPKSRCFDGLFTTLLEEKEVFNVFEQAGNSQ